MVVVRTVAGVEVDYTWRNHVAEQVLRMHKVISVDQLRSVFTVYTRGGSADGSTAKLIRRRTMQDWAAGTGFLHRSGDWLLASQGAAKASKVSNASLPHDAVCTSLALDLELNKSADCVEFEAVEAEGVTLPDLVYTVNDRTVAFEVELTQKSYPRYIEILAAHQSRVKRGDYERVVYLCRSERIAKTVTRTLNEFGYDDWLRVEELGDYTDRHFCGLPGWEYALERRRQ